MEVLGLIMVLGMFFLTAESQTLSPSTQFDVLGIGEPDKHCRPATQEELARANSLPKGKAATFHMRGFYRCERDVFEYGERNSFVNLVTKGASAHAAYTARRVKDIMKFASKEPISIDIVTDVEVLKPYLYSTYSNALQLSLGSGSVGRLPAELAHSATRVRVHVRRLDDVASLFHSELYRANIGTGEWIVL